MKSALTAGFVACALFVQQAAAGWGDAPSFSNVGNTDNNCTVEQTPGFNWGALPVGNFNKFGGLDFSGFSCKDSFQPGPGAKRSLQTRTQFQSKCIQGKVSQERNTSPNFSSGEADQFSITHMDVSVDFDTDMDFIFSMPDGSTCKHTAACKAGGTTVQNKQCGGARSVTFQLPPSGGNKDCNMGIHFIGFDCNPRPPTSSSTTTTTTTQSPTTTTTPQTTTTTTTVDTTTTSKVETTTTTTTTPSLTTTTTTTTASTTTTTAVTTTTTTTSDVGTTTPTTTPGTTTKPCGEEGGPACSTTTTPATTSTTTKDCGEEGGPECSTTSTTTKPCGEEGGPVCSTTTTTTTPSTTSPCGENGGPGCSTTTPSTTTPSTTPPCGENGGPDCSTTTTTTTTPIKPCGEEGGPGCSTTTTTTTVPTPSTTTKPCGENDFPGCSPSTTTTPSTFTSVTLPPPSSTTPQTTTTTTTPVIPPESSAPCPSVLPKCLNTWLKLTACASNSDKDCFCPSVEFIANVQDCVSSWSASRDEIQAALSYLAGICADFVPQNPGICTGVPRDITLVPTITPVPETSASATGTGIGRGPRPPVSPPTSVPVTTITFTQTVSETVVTTTVTVPQVSFVTARPSGFNGEGRPAEVGLVPAVPAQTTSAAPVASTEVANAGSSPSQTFSSRPTGSGVVPDVFTGAASKTSVAFGIVGGALVVAAFFA